MKKIILSTAIILSSQTFAASLEEDVVLLKKEIELLKKDQKENNTKDEKLADVVEKIETQAFTNKINFGGEVSIRADQFKNTVDDIGGSAMTSSTYENFSTTPDPMISAKFRLNMKANILDNVNFNGSLEATRNSSTNSRIATQKNIKIQTQYQDTTFEIARAYVDVKINDMFSFDFGILPTAGGFSNHLADNKPRQSMFPGLIFDMSSYGAFATVNLDSISKNTIIRAILAKAYTHDTDKYFYQSNRENIKNADIMGLFVEKKINDTLVYAGVNRLGSLKATPLVSPTSIVTDMPSDLGDILNYGLGAESSKIAGSGLTIFTHLAFSAPSESGAIANYSAAIPYATGEMLDGNGHAFHVGGQYVFGSTKFGLEYNQGSKYWFSGTQGAEDPFNKLATRGSVVEAYVIQNINKYVYAKVGALQINEDYTGSGWHFAEPLTKDAKQTDVYVQLGASF